jgi:hypothetical protein
MRGIAATTDWYTRDVPAAILAGQPLPPAPARGPRRRGLGLFRSRA